MSTNNDVNTRDFREKELRVGRDSASGAYLDGCEIYKLAVWLRLARIPVSDTNKAVS
jgi:hypothetical protein